MPGTKYCPLHIESVPCTFRCSWYDESTHCCDISRIAVSLDDIAGILEEMNAKPCAQEEGR